ncbi:MAG: AAA family ATPase [Methanocellales archaeon]|nr:AAA family ATPase [Methanocellales archaeon]MDD3291147.1 AAA family ATPase [Methanocellales archaeon]MDD5235247.1 AAA family ATPase [Methanocellales archaeon]MDD5484597.1 AAA family ATPase [Methanocellales archaeon]
MIITLGGLSGSGTSTVGRMLADMLQFDIVSAGDMFRNMAKERGVSLLELGKLAEVDPKIDKMIDERQAEIAKKKDNVLIEGRLSGWMVDGDIKIWLKAPVESRCSRVASREGIPFDQALHDAKERDECDAKRHRELYQIDINDLTHYDLVVDSSKWDKDGVAKILYASIKALGDKK